MNTIAIIGIIISVIGIVLIVFITKYNKYQLSLIKINKGEINISSNLEKKYNILKRYMEYMENNISTNNDDFDKYRSLNNKMSINKLNKELNNLNNTINKYLDNNEKLLKDETIIEIEKELLEVNIKINGCKKYYNDNLVEYNRLCNTFPSNIIGKIFKYSEKEFIEEENQEQLKILDE